MNQRLGIAAALLGDPETVLFDEPINGLDPDGILWIRNLVKSLAAQGRTVFLSSHLMSEMAQTADHLLVIDRGRITADASTAEFVNRNSAPAVQVRAVQQDLLADALSRRGGDRRSRLRPRHHPPRAGRAQRQARGGLLRADPRRNRLPRLPAGQLKQGDLT